MNEIKRLARPVPLADHVRPALDALTAWRRQVEAAHRTRCSLARVLATAEEVRSRSRR